MLPVQLSGSALRLAIAKSNLNKLSTVHLLDSLHGSDTVTDSCAQIPDLNSLETIIITAFEHPKGFFEEIVRRPEPASRKRDIVPTKF